MPRTQGLANASQAFYSNIWNVAAKIQQDRSLHLHEMDNLYMEACLHEMPDQFLSLLEATIADRSTYNARKTVLDAVELSSHDSKMVDALGANEGVLRGGGVQARGHSAKQGLKYATSRSAALLDNLHRKLMHDRSLHHQELSNLYMEGVRNDLPSSYMGMMEGMLHDRKVYNTRKTSLDAAQWAEVDAYAAENLGSMAAGQLAGGATKRRSKGRRHIKSKSKSRSRSTGRHHPSSPRKSNHAHSPRKSKSMDRHHDPHSPRKYTVECAGDLYNRKDSFNNLEAANVWKDIMTARDHKCHNV